MLMNIDEKFLPFEQRLREAGLNELLIDNFKYNYIRLLNNDLGFLPEKDITPVTSLPSLVDLTNEDQKIGDEHLNQVVVIKLNGGLGTNMGLERAKSLLPVKGNLSFLNIITEQVLHHHLPLLFMNSFNTHDDTQKSLKEYKKLNQSLPIDFIQHKVLKINAKDLSPAIYPKQRELEWCPPGHGDLYIAAHACGILDMMLDQKYTFAFVSNADNLGAVIDGRILGYMVRNHLDFLMEVVDRTARDRKGGHLAMQDGRFTLREIAQCPETDKQFFEDIKRHRYFNTNNLWLNLKSLKRLLHKVDYSLPLPLIVNRKHIDPVDHESPEIYQLETAMGAAIAVFDNASALNVPRSRFAPVKNTNELLLVSSDYYELLDTYQLVPANPAADSFVTIELDHHYYKFIKDFNERFPFGVPSLKDCRRLVVQGNVYWGKNIRCEGDVVISNSTDIPQIIPSDTTISGKLSW
ncbi:MAG: UTP--glucose-1-phosphate uridylyltransferase [Calditrichaeota bacterium]|nr:MAG: UTP--glucose-1-phosphate uridylyltransferase [Calditrichota bacterium]